MHETATAELTKFKNNAEYNLKLARKELMWAERSVVSATETITKAQADIDSFESAIRHLARVDRISLFVDKNSGKLTVTGTINVTGQAEK